MASYNGINGNSSISKATGIDRFCPEDVSLLKSMVLKMENRMVKEYEEIKFSLSALLNTSLAKQDQLENNIKEMQAEVRKLCAFLSLDSEGFMTVASSTSGDAKEDQRTQGHETEFNGDGEQMTEGEEEVIPVPSDPDLSHGFKNLSVDDAASAAAAVNRNSGSASVGFIPIPVPKFETTIVKESSKAGSDCDSISDPPKTKVFDVVDSSVFSSSSESAKPTLAVAPNKKEWSPDRIKTQKRIVQLRAKQEAPGVSLEGVSVRVFDGIFDLDVLGRNHKVRFNLVRYQQEKALELMVCFPHVPSRASDPAEAYFGNFTVNYEFVNMAKHRVVSGSFEVDAGDGTCILPEANPDQHLKCADCTWTIEIEDPVQFNWIDDKCVQMKELPNGNQAYFINGSFELIPLPPSAGESLPADGDVDTVFVEDNNDVTPIPIAGEEISAQSVHGVTVTVPGRKEGDTKTDSTPGHSSISSGDFDDHVHENLDHINTDDQSAEARKAFEDWRNNRSARLTWFDDTNLNIELLLLAYENSIESLKERCADNLMAATTRSIDVDQLTLIKEVAEMASLLELDEFCSHRLSLIA